MINGVHTKIFTGPGILKMDNVVLTPHTASATIDGQRRPLDWKMRSQKLS